MLNHFHLEASFESIHDMEAFMNSVTSVFAKKYNRHYGLSRQLFHRPFGNSLKSKEAHCFDCLIYIGNNAKVKHAVTRAEEYRWNFLKYMECNCPFSTPYNPSTASADMQRLVKLLKNQAIKDSYIDYAFFESKDYFRLTDFEKQQLIDMIVSQYNVIDYDFSLKRYGSAPKIYEAMNIVSGSEYGSGEDNDQENYQHYYKMIKIAKSEGYDMQKTRYVGIGDGPGQMPTALYERLCRRFEQELRPSRTEIKKYFSIADDS